MKVQFFFIKNESVLKDRTKLKQFIPTVFSKEKKKLGSLLYIFCSDDYLLEINKAYLKHNYYTDIITFSLSELNRPIEGEIYISVDRVRDNALQLGTTIKEELHRVIFHGALHLCGYKDKSSKEEALMRKVEGKYLDLYFA
ncbi:rRNA maturation RNase YbeY [Ferruginibacter lapsinanis]|uniref:rRNA maturation RNase YbeY n=1 Tax=Ferruginibacter lapsinanis TaxID=563172 RepID=UPI001E61065C|nr:rRNA maturation RNase YbeY [Ferruginibacter lapsinanis]UEG50745.1 rRNA maturation RNase YbeY [Ferruginibacter lapsinanis]